MRSARLLALAVVLSMLTALVAHSESRGQSVGQEEATKWTRRVIPKPHEIVIGRKILATRDQIAITLLPSAGLLEREAAAELADGLAYKTGARINVGPERNSKNALEIVLGCCDKDGKVAGREAPGAARLFTLPNREQAYRIVPLGPRTLALVGIRPQGVYYAAKTLKQLISSAPSSLPGQVAVPMAEVTDWPDLAERGLWGGSANEDIEWLAERKMNLLESHVGLSVDANGHGTAAISENLLSRAKRHAVKLVPIVTHLEQLPAEVLARLPELKGAGLHDVDSCAGLLLATEGRANPRRLAHLSGALSRGERRQRLALGGRRFLPVPEMQGRQPVRAPDASHCPRLAGRPARQTRLAVAAVADARELREQRQGFGRGAAQVGITYYDGGRTYESSRHPMIYPLLEKYAAEGRWLGCYPQLTASWRVVAPWSAPQFIKARMSEFVGKRLQCLCGYATPSNRFFEFNVTAAAEWSWNACGRSERDFALAWATRQGLADPETAADWAVTLGPVGWDVYGGHPLLGWIYGGAADILKPAARPQLGAGRFVYFPTPQHFDADLATCDRAMSMAKGLQSPAAVEETHVIHGLVGMLKGLYLVADATAAGKKMTAGDRRRAADALNLLDRAGQEARDGLLAWGNIVSPQFLPCRFDDTVDCLDRVMTEASDTATGLGVPDPAQPYRVRRIGQWTNGTFQSGPSQQVTWPVSQFVAGPGPYEVAFHYDDRGWYGVEIRQVRLVSGVGDAAPLAELARDAHQGISRGQSKNTTYRLGLKTYDPKRRDFVVADLVGIRLTSPSDRSASVGCATIRKCKPGDGRPAGQ